MPPLRSTRTARLSWTPRARPDIANGQYSPSLHEARIGVMLHYDGSGTDLGALAWFAHPDCRVSYNYLVLDDGSYIAIAPVTARAWHAGVCRPSDPRLPYQDANSAFIGIAAATTDPVQVTIPQLFTVAWLTHRTFLAEGWALHETYRIVGHNSEAWPRGRKVDPAGKEPRNPVLSVESIRTLLGML